MSGPPFAPPSSAEIELVSRQLGRKARGVIGIAARCVCGNPTVVATSPRLPDGSPFPTLYYLTNPVATAAISRLEASGAMSLLQESLADESYARSYRLAHEAYLADREKIAKVAEIAGFSAGGMPERVKCLHALAAHSLAVGHGVNLVGDQALVWASWSPNRCSCRDFEVS